MNTKISIAIISNVIFEPKFTALMRKYFTLSDMNVNIYPIPYDEYNCQEYTSQIKLADIIVVWLNFEALLPDVWNHIYEDKQEYDHIILQIIDVCENVFNDIKSVSRANILWFTFEDYYLKFNLSISYNPTYTLVDEINNKLYNKLLNKVSFIDLKRLIAEIGVNNSYDQKSKYRWNSPYSIILVDTAVKNIYKQYLTEKGFTKKCLVLDCDNVLWGGVLSEDGIENLQLSSSGFGRSYQDFQRYILSLYCHGVILAVCSKNDLTDVITVFKEHSEMILKEKHIACFQVNWDNKPNNIKNIASTLNIGLDSIVFVDDSPIEVEAVKSMLPEVTAILYDRDSVYNGLSCFNLKSNVSRADIEKRNETYRTNQSRETLKSQYQSYDEYIAALEIKTDIHEALPIEYSRIAELTQRTNKCTNGKRYTVAEIKDRVVCENVKLYSLSVSDRFSDLGLVGALEVEGETLTLFCLSCRALGREIEGKLLEFIAGKHQLHKIMFKSTGKNEGVKSILAQEFPNAALTNCENA